MTHSSVEIVGQAADYLDLVDDGLADHYRREFWALIGGGTEGGINRQPAVFAKFTLVKIRIRIDRPAVRTDDPIRIGLVERGESGKEVRKIECDLLHQLAAASFYFCQLCLSDIGFSFLDQHLALSGKLGQTLPLDGRLVFRAWPAPAATFAGLRPAASRLWLPYFVHLGQDSELNSKEPTQPIGCIVIGIHMKSRDFGQFGLYFLPPFWLAMGSPIVRTARPWASYVVLPHPDPRDTPDGRVYLTDEALRPSR